MVCRRKLKGRPKRLPQPHPPAIDMPTDIVVTSASATVSEETSRSRDLGLGPSPRSGPSSAATSSSSSSAASSSRAFDPGTLAAYHHHRHSLSIGHTHRESSAFVPVVPSRLHLTPYPGEMHPHLPGPPPASSSSTNSEHEVGPESSVARKSSSSYEIMAMMADKRKELAARALLLPPPPLLEHPPGYPVFAGPFPGSSALYPPGGPLAHQHLDRRDLERPVERPDRRNNLFVNSVIDSLRNRTIFSFTRELIPTRGHIPATFVAKHLGGRIILGITGISIVRRNLSNATNVARASARVAL